MSSIYIYLNISSVITFLNVSYSLFCFYLIKYIIYKGLWWITDAIFNRHFIIYAMSVFVSITCITIITGCRL